MLLRGGLLFVTLVVSLAVGAILLHLPGATLLAVLGLVVLYLAFWIGVTLLITRLGRSSVTNAATLAGLWLVLTLILPTVVHVAINQAIPVGQGVELTLARRDGRPRVGHTARGHDARLLREPSRKDSPPLTDAFHYKWYLAFHQIGDDSVAPKVPAYRHGIEARDAAAHSIGWLLLSVVVQSVLVRLANTDMQAQLAYQDRLRAFHKRLRNFYYGYLFTDKTFGSRLR